jgi:hypothetical protein
MESVFGDDVEDKYILIIRQTLKNVWKNASTSNGGYDIKLHYVNVPSTSLVYPIVLDISNNSGQQHIYIKARMFVEVLKGFALQVQKKNTVCISNQPSIFYGHFTKWAVCRIA